VETRPQAIVIPTQVINAGPNGPFAYVVKADDSVEVRNLVLGPRTEAMTLVEEGLKVGETVVLDGQSKLRPGATISIQPAQP
jgi:multidrug efflux system membrane fusion protein